MGNFLIEHSKSCLSFYLFCKLLPKNETTDKLVGDEVEEKGVSTISNNKVTKITSVNWKFEKS